MFQFNARPGMMIHQVKRTDHAESGIMQHPTLCPSPHLSHPAVVGDVPHNPDSKHPE
ncbi:hypothetical protein A2U01_0063782, partial [Trifolium medium]|nr:hypothetical protein [Trifolium medium]